MGILSKLFGKGKTTENEPTVKYNELISWKEASP